MCIVPPQLLQSPVLEAGEKFQWIMFPSGNDGVPQGVMVMVMVMVVVMVRIRVRVRVSVRLG